MGCYAFNTGIALLESANSIDAVIILVCLIAALIGFWTGFVWQIVRLVSWLVALWGAAQFHGMIASMFDFGLEEETRGFIAYLAVFVLILVICYIIARLISRMVEALHLSLPDRIAGGFLGCVKGLCFCGVIALAVLHFLSPESTLNQMFSDSYLASMSAKGVAIIWLLLPVGGGL